MKTNTTSENNLRAFRQINGEWRYIGNSNEVDMQPTDKVGYDYPAEDNAELLGYQTWEEWQNSTGSRNET